MIRGFYSAASGALTQQKNINVISNNISNASTYGFKSQATVNSTFRDHLVSRISDTNFSGGAEKIGPGNFMAVAIGEYTNYTQGTIDTTDVPTNMAINGEGFFVVESEKYGQMMTRNGAFRLDDEGYLTLPGTGRVLNDGGQPITLESSNFSVAKNGDLVDSEGQVLDTLYIATVPEGTELKKVGEDCFRAEDEGYIQADTVGYQVLGSALERSNVSMSTELSQLMAGQRNFQSCTQVIKIYDKLNDQTIQLGRL